MPEKDYLVRDSSINEPGTYAHVWIGPGSINEPLQYPAAVPVLLNLAPKQMSVNGPPVRNVNVTGKGFGPWSVVTYDGRDVETVFVSSTQLTLRAKASEQVVGNHAVRVRNALHRSNEVVFTFNNNLED